MLFVGLVDVVESGTLVTQPPFVASNPFRGLQQRSRRAAGGEVSNIPPADAHASCRHYSRSVLTIGIEQLTNAT